MRNIELEEGEAYFLQDDDDENIDPDKDFSYIDRKIENVLGQYQKDFMGGLSAESLGARFGGYGSFLPMQQRSPPILSNQRNQSLISSKSPQDSSSEHFCQNPTIAATHSLPTRFMPGSGDQNVEPMSESRTSSMIDQVKIQSSVECASIHQKKKTMISHSEKNSLKFRVKMAPENVSCLDKSAIYSGLGLDMSPFSSPEGSPSDNDGTLTGLPDMNLESPSFIVEIMTTIPLQNNDLLSPLHDSLIHLRGMENKLETCLAGIRNTPPVDIAQGNMYSKAKKEDRKERKLKVKDTNKVKKSKHMDRSVEKLSKKKVHSQKAVESVENCEYPSNIVSLSATRREQIGASMAKEVSSAPHIAVGVYSKEKEVAPLMGKVTGSKPSFEFDKRNELECLGEEIDNPMKRASRHKVKEEPGSAKKHGAAEADMNAITLKEKTTKDKIVNFTRSDSSINKKHEVRWREDEVNTFSKQNNILKDKVKEEALNSAHLKDKNVSLIPKSESSTEKRNEGQREIEEDKFLKQQNMAKDKVKEEVFDLACLIEAGVYNKANAVAERIPKDEEVHFQSLKDEEHYKYSDVSQEMKCDNVVALESLKQKSHSRVLTPSLPEQGLPIEKENLSSVVKRKLKASEIGEISIAEPPRGSSTVSSAAAKNERVIFKNNVPSKSKKVDIDLHRGMGKDNEVAVQVNPMKKGKEVSSKDNGMGVSGRETQSFATKLKDKSSNNKSSFTSNIGSNMEGDLAGVNCMTDKVPVGDLLPAENAPVLTLEDWVECEECHKWRLLPLGMSASSLIEKFWTCSMLTWLPGMNKCSFSEDETADALRASYVPLDPASLVQNNQPAYLDANASVNMSNGPHVILPCRTTTADALPSGGKRKTLVKTETDAAWQSGIQDSHIPVKKDQQRSGETRNLKNLKKKSRKLDATWKCAAGDGKPSKIEMKRAADVEAYGVPKKMKRAHIQHMEDCSPGALRAPQDFSKGSSKYPVVKAKDRSQGDMTSKNDEIYDVSGKKRRLKGKQHRVFSAVVPSGKGNHFVNSREAGKNRTEYRKDKKSKSSNFQASESSADKGHMKTQCDDAKSKFIVAGDSTLHKGGRSNGMPLEQYHVDRVSRKTLGGRKSSEMAFDLGLSNNATTSSSSKITCKVRAKVHEVKSSPIRSISSSPIKVSKPDPDKGASKKPISCNEQRPKSGAEIAANEFAPHEGFRDRKSNLSKNSGFITGAADEDHFGKKVSSGRHPSPHTCDNQPKFVNYKDTGGKLDPVYEGTLTSQQNLVAEYQMAKSPNKLHFGGTNLVKGKSHASKIDSEKEVSSDSLGAPEYEGVGGSNGARINYGNEKPTGQVAVGHVSLRQSHHTGHISYDIEASSSRKKDGFHRAAKTALREARDLKHSADHMKVSGSGLESTGIFFQAALKFLHGASLLEPGNSESQDMTPNEVYTSTAKLCEYCALEFERCNDMAFASLAYKCMEVAYMRVVFCNDLAASRDRLELQVAVRSAPQVDSPSSSASDIDNLNQATIDTIKDGHSAMDHRIHVVSAENRPNFMRLLDFTHDINLAMEASRRSQSAFAAAMSVFTHAGNEEGLTCVKRVLDFSFHDVDGLLHLVRLAMESIQP